MWLINKIFVISAVCCICSVNADILSAKNRAARLMEPVVGIVVVDSNSTDNSDNNGDKVDGSGFIVDETGFILTNCHVVEGADRIEVVIHDGSKYIAKLVGKDSRSDTALLKIDVDRKLPTVTFANSDNINVTTPVYAVGNPFGFGTSVTAGIISSKVRNLPSQMGDIKNDVPFLQTDAAINYGNSGGPLYTYDGEVVGMVTVFVSDGMQNTGISLAIPSNLLQKAVTQLRNFGKLRRSWVGITAVPLDRDVESALGLGKRCGYAIVAVEKASPADLAGIQEDDILLSINNEDIEENMNIDYMLANLPLDKVIPMVVMRSGHEMNFNIRVGIKEEDDSIVSQESAPKKEIAYQKIDSIPVGVADLTPDLRKCFGIPTQLEGVMIANVGKRPSEMSIGNVILRVNQKKISNVTDLINEIGSITSSKAAKVALYVYDPNRQPQRFYVVFRLMYATPKK